MNPPENGSRISVRPELPGQPMGFTAGREDTSTRTKLNFRDPDRLRYVRRSVDQISKPCPGGPDSIGPNALDRKIRDRSPVHFGFQALRSYGIDLLIRSKKQIRRSRGAWLIRIGGYSRSAYEALRRRAKKTCCPLSFSAAVSGHASHSLPAWKRMQRACQWIALHPSLEHRSP